MPNSTAVILAGGADGPAAGTMGGSNAAGLSPHHSWMEKREHGAPNTRPPSRLSLSFEPAVSGGGGRRASNRLLGRLNEGTVHRVPAAALEAAKTEAVPSSRLSTLTRKRITKGAATASTIRLGGGTISKMVQDMSSRNTWAASFATASNLRSCITTENDDYTAFEARLVEEVNLLRRDPHSYAALLEREATLGSPFVSDDDDFFSTVAAAEEAGRRYGRVCAGLQAATGGEDTGAESGANSKMSPKGTDGRQSATSRRTGPSVTLVTAASPARNASGATPTTAASTAVPPPSSATSVAPPSSSVSEGTGGTPRLAPKFPLEGLLSDDEISFRTTLRSQGLRELNLEQLRLHFRCLQRYRAALETSLNDVREAWSRAEAMQRAAWVAENERVQKRLRRSGAGNPTLHSRKANPSSGAQSTTASHDLTAQRRQTESGELHSRFQEHYTVVETQLHRTRQACQRAMAGANLILDTLRALKAAQPAPPLRHNRGLSLAARDTTNSYYGKEERVSTLREVFTAARTMLTFGQGASSNTAATSDDPPLTTDEKTHDGESGAKTEEKQRASADANASRRETNPEDTDEGVLRAMLAEEADTLASVAEEACGKYGYISGEVRGIQLSGVGSPRTLILHLLLGCLTPAFALTNRAPRRLAGELLSSTYSASLNKAMRGETCCYAATRIGGQPFPTTKAAEAVMLSLGDSSTATTSIAKRANEAAQRLWPLLWPQAHTLGCSWQLVHGFRDIPTYEEAMELESQSSTSMTMHGSAATTKNAVVSTMLLLASGYEEFDVVRQSGHLPPSSLQRIVLSAAAAQSTTGSDAYSYKERQAAVDLHSALGLSLLYPASHPVQIVRVGAAAQAYICILLRAPMPPGRERVLAQVTPQSMTVPLAPKQCPAETLVQRSAVDPSVWIVLINLSFALGRLRRRNHPEDTPKRATAALVAASLSGESSTSPRPRWTSSDEALAIHFFEREMTAPASAFEPVGFLRVTEAHLASAGATGAATLRGTGGREDGSSTEADGSATTSAAASLVVPAQWGHLLRGMQLPEGMSATGGAEGGLLPQRQESTVAIGEAPGWACLMEPLLARCGTLLCPLSASLRCNGDGGGGIDSAEVRLWLPTWGTVRWLSSRITALRSLIAELEEAEQLELNGVSPPKEASADGVASVVEKDGSDESAPAEGSSAALGSTTVCEATVSVPELGTTSQPPLDPETNMHPTLIDLPAEPLPEAVGKSSSARRSSVAHRSTGSERHSSTHRKLSLYQIPPPPTSTALLQYTALVPSVASGAAPSTTSLLSNNGNASASSADSALSKLSISDLRLLSEELTRDAAVWAIYFNSTAPPLQRERERLVADALRKKGKEQIRILHDKEDIDEELQQLMKRGEALGRATRHVKESIMRRERATLLRQARLVRASAALAHFEQQQAAVPPTFPRLALRLFRAGGAAGNGRNAVMMRVDASMSFSSETFMGDGALRHGGNADAASHFSFLPPQVEAGENSQDIPLFSVRQDEMGAEFATSHVEIPSGFQGSAVLFIDDEAAVRWSV